MFWTNIYALSPHIEALLNKEDVTLLELMDQDEIVTECKSQNKKLVDFLAKPEIIEELVTLTTKEPLNEVEDGCRFKYPNVACELLTCNVPTLHEKLAGSEQLLSKLYTFIDTDKPLNPLLASFFSKIIGVLLTRKSDQNWYSYQFMCLQVLEFLKTRQQCVDRLLQHLETSAIMDLVLMLVTKVEGPDMRQNILNWLDNQQLVQRLIKLLSPTSEPSRHANAAQLLCDIIKSAREFRLTCTERTDPDPILNTLESPETVSLLLDTIVTGEPMESSIVGGIQVLLVLLCPGTSNLSDQEVVGNNSTNDTTDNVDRVKIQNSNLPYLDRLQQLLINPPPKPPVRTTAGVLEKPLGNTRLHIAKYLTALLATENIKIFQKLAELGTFQTLLDLFFKYSWNNFLHTQVEQCFALVITGNWQEDSDSVYTHIFCQCKLIERILDAWAGNDSNQSKEKGIRQGYMGHLISIANCIVKQSEKSEEFVKFLKANLTTECFNKWDNLVNTQLAEVNKTHQIMLGGKAQSFMTSSEDSSDDYTYSQDAYIQQVYANYQGQIMTSHFIENFGFHDDEFNDGNDALQPSNSVDQLTTMPFTLSEEDLVKKEDIFNKICQQKQKSGLDEGGVEWGDEGDMTFQTVIDKRGWPFKQQQHDSTSSDEDEETKDMHMDIDAADPWDIPEPLASTNPLPPVNPWEVSSSATEESSGWANFDNFESTLNIAGSQASPPQPSSPPQPAITTPAQSQIKNETTNEATKQEPVPDTTTTISYKEALETSTEKKTIVNETEKKKSDETSIVAESPPTSATTTSKPEKSAQSESKVEEPGDKPRALTTL